MSRPSAPGTPGHARVSVPLEETAELALAWGIGRRVNLFADERPAGWIRVLALRRVDERAGEAEYLLAFAACEPPAPRVCRLHAEGCDHHQPDDDPRQAAQTVTTA